MAMLTINGLTKNFGGLIAVNDVTLEAKKGEITSIIGPNGAGKTTIFNMLTGVYKPTSGEIYFEGKEIQGKSPQEIVGFGIARTFQNIRLFKSMRVIENVWVGNHIHIDYTFIDLLFRTRKFKQFEKESIQKAIDILSSIGIEDKMQDYAINLSYGDQRKVEIARAIATGAKMLILDEPAAGMNPQETESLIDFIKKLNDDGYTLLLIEHDMNFIMNISNKIFVLDYGKLIAQGLPSEVANDKRVIEAYLGIDDINNMAEEF